MVRVAYRVKDPVEGTFVVIAGDFADDSIAKYVCDQYGYEVSVRLSRLSRTVNMHAPVYVWFDENKTPLAVEDPRAKQLLWMHVHFTPGQRLRDTIGCHH